MPLDSSAITDLCTKLGKAFYAQKTCETQNAALETEVEDYTDEFTTGSVFEKAATNTVESAVLAMRNARQQFSNAITQSISKYITEIVAANSPNPPKNINDAIASLIDDFGTAGEDFDSSTIGSSLSYGGSNAGDGIVVVSTKRPDGKVQEFSFDETLLLTATSVNSGAALFSVQGERAEQLLSPAWPGGSGAVTSAYSRLAEDNTNLVTNGGFENTEDSYSVHLPSDWQVAVGTLGTTLKVTTVEIQTVIISGNPASGYYVLNFTNADGDVVQTSPLAHNATQSDVQSALQAIEGLEDVEVVTTGTTPNYTHTITFYGVPNPTQLTSTSGLNTGSIAHATSTAGSANVVRGARAVEFDSNGSQLTAIQQIVSVSAKRQYAVGLLLKADVVPAAGVITVDLVDGIGGTVIADDAGTNNTTTISISGLGDTNFHAYGVAFRTPSTLPANVYLRIRISTAITNTSSVFIDDVQMVEMTKLYAGGPSIAVMPGKVNWAVDDEISLTITNNRAGEFHEKMNRHFNLMQQELLFPTAGSGSQADTLIA